MYNVHEYGVHGSAGYMMLVLSWFAGVALDMIGGVEMVFMQLDKMKERHVRGLLDCVVLIYQGYGLLWH
jgi:hypothetical protein